MKNLTAILATFGVLSTAGCSTHPYTQVQIAYATEKYSPKTEKTSLTCARARYGDKAFKSEEFRLGADVCYGKMPDITFEKKFDVVLPYTNEPKTVTAQGITKQYQVSISIPIDYKLVSIGANLPTNIPSELRLRAPGAQDVSLSLWGTLGYNLDIITQKTDYSAGGGTIDNIPGAEFKGQPYGEIAHELTLFGRIPVGMSVRFDTNLKVKTIFSSGVRVQW